MISAVVVAAGASSRFAESCPDWVPQHLRDKTQTLLFDIPVWLWSVRTLRSHPDISEVIVVCPKGKKSEFENYGLPVVEGGEERKQSVLNGVRATNESSELVLVHDAARPYLSHSLIDRVIKATREFGAAIPGIQITDTVKRGSDRVEETVDRKNLWRIQTPQAAKRNQLIEALEKSDSVTDESSALVALGLSVKIVTGDERNIKITVFEDLDRLAGLARPRSGIGYDIHAFSDNPNRPLILGGIQFLGERGLEGHSDADVVLHAITDAMLGCIGGGDIGQLFPPEDMKWKDADSVLFLREARRLMGQKLTVLSGVDVTIIAEHPKIGPKTIEMRTKIAQELGLSVDKVNIKATTQEGLGAIGRGEGIAAMAIVTAQALGS